MKSNEIVKIWVPSDFKTKLKKLAADQNISMLELARNLDLNMKRNDNKKVGKFHL